MDLLKFISIGKDFIYELQLIVIEYFTFISRMIFPQVDGRSTTKVLQ